MNLQDQANAFDDEEDKEYRVLELKYDKLYQEIYELRRKVIQGESLDENDLLAEYEKRAAELNDEDFKKVEANPVDVKDIQNTPKGVPAFWLKAMINHPGIGKIIQEKDRQILMNLQDVTCTLHQQGYGFDIIFTFEKNDYFTNTVLKKSFVMSKQNIIEKCEGTEIDWKEGKDITKKKMKKKNKKKQTVTKTVEQESFFNFFKTITLPEEKDLEKIDEEEEKDLGDKMDEDFDMGNEFKDQLIPLALEYYLEVIEDEGDEGDSDEDNIGEKDSDSEDEGKPTKAAKKKGGKAAGKKGGEGDQQECKQQ